MKSLYVILVLFSLFFFLLFFSYPVESIETPFVEKWFVNLETLDIGEQDYKSHIAPVIADTIDNGLGPMNKPILEIYQQAGIKESDGITTSGHVYCFKGDTGEIIWSYFDEGLAVHATLELGDADNDGKLELLVSGYNHVALLNSEDGSVVWSFDDWTHRRDKHNLIIKDPDDNQTYVYTSQMSGYLEKRNASTGEIITKSSYYTAGPCFGGLACADLEGDGSLELIESGGGLYCYNLDLNLLWRKTSGSCNGACPIIADVNKDGVLDVIGCMFGWTNGGIGIVDGLTGDWMELNGITRFDTTLGLPTHDTARVYDIDLDGNLEYITASVNPDGENSLTKVWDLYDWKLDAEFEPRWGPAPMVENVMGDEKKELVHLGYYWKIYNHTYDIIGKHTEDRTGKNPHVVADVDGDGYSELVTMYRKYFNGDPSNAVCAVFDLPVLSPNSEVRCWNQLYSEQRCGVEEYLPSLAPLVEDDEHCFSLTNFSIYPPIQNYGRYVNVSAEISMNTEIADIFVNITYPNISWINMSIINNQSGSRFYSNRSYDMLGNYSCILGCSYNSGTSLYSSVSNFVINDSSPPDISNIKINLSSPIYTNPLFGWVNLSCSISDNHLIKNCGIHIIFVNGSEKNCSLIELGFSNFFRMITLNGSGRYSYYFWAIDFTGNLIKSDNLSLIVTENWDINMDGSISLIDLTLIANDYGRSGDLGWIRSDVDNSGVVDLFDLLMVANHFGCV